MAELKEIPSREALRALLGDERLAAWTRMAGLIDSLYDMEKQWNDGGKRWKIEHKFRRGGKTLCCLYADEGRFGLMIIFGADERARVEAVRQELSGETMETYDNAAVYHDGKWVMFDEKLPDGDLERLLKIKRRPNKK